MLETFRSFFRSKTGAFISLLVLGLIALAFASADVSNSGGFGGVAGGDRVATVGKERIDTAALNQAATSALENVKQQNPTMSMQAFLAAGGLDKVLDDLISRTAIAAFGRASGIVASDRLVDSEIAKIPAFRGPDGQFSETAFRQAIAQRGLSEKLVRDDLAQGLIARQVLLPAGIGASMPRELGMRYAALLREQRKGAIALLPSAAFAPTAAPSDAVLQKYYTDHRAKFIRPERRVIRYATFGEEAVKAVPPPTEAEIAARYKAQAALYAPLESRRLTQLIVPTEAAAKAVAAEVAAGKSLEAAASTKGLSAAAIGPVAKAAFAGQSSQAVADAAFAAARGALAAPARSGLGWHLLRVDAVEQRAGKTIDQARSELTAQLTEVKRRAALSDLSAKIEDAFDSGSNLADEAKGLGLTLAQTPALTADGAVYANPAERAPPVLARVLQTAFAMERENEPQLAEVDPGKVFVIYDVTDIAASAPAPLAEIKADVTDVWKLAQGYAAAKAAAETVRAAVSKGTPLPAAMASLKRPLPPVQSVDLGRQDLARMGQQPPPALVLLFSMAKKTVKILPAPGDRGLFVVALADIVPAAIDANDPMVAAAQAELGKIAGNEYADQLRRAVAAEVGVTRNAAAIRAVRNQLTGGN
jgi:peptidyl-prolyl cis-trans isomerase D